MKRKEIEELVSKWAEEIIADSDQELVDVEYVKEGSNFVLRVFIDKPGGIGVEDCREVSIALSKRLDSQDPIPNAYSLEVSSPGLERPLKKEADFQRFAGHEIHIKTYQPIEGKKKITGTLVGLVEGEVSVETAQGTTTVPLDQIAKAHLTVEF